ncbi:MAG: PAS domain S-box protein [Chloroflexi bacterium]|nr:PAS domain S-box protein [Chloroflexota bacterium]
MTQDPLNVLLIEDNPGDARLIREMLAEVCPSHCRLEHADRLATGLALLAQAHYDAVLLDLGLPDSQGLDALARVQAQAPDLPLVVLTGSYLDEDLALRAVQEGAQDYLVKGEVEGHVLVRALRYAIERKRAETALRASEERFRSLLQTAPSVILALSPDGRIVEFNQEAERLYGRTREEVLGQDYLAAFLPEAVRNAVAADMANVLGGAPTRGFENPVRGSDGRERVLVWNVDRVLDCQGQPVAILAVGQDITARKRAEEDLRASEERFRLLAETAQDTNFRYRLVPTPGAEYVSPAATTMFGYTPEEYYADPALIFNVVHPDDRPLLEAHLRNPAAAPAPSLRWIRKDGTTIWTEQRIVPLVDAAGNVVAIQGICRDVTERVRTEQALRRWADIFEFTRWGVVVGSDDGTTLEMMNPYFAEMHGYTVEELTGRPIADVFAPECRADLPERTRIAHEQGHYTWESQHLRKDGTVFPVLIDVTAVKDEQGKVLYRIVNVQDITERKRAEEERERLLTELEAERNWLRTVIDRSPAGIILIEDAAGTRITANRRAEELFGRPLSSEGGIAQYVGQVCRPDGTPLAAEELVSRRALRGETIVMEEMLLPQPGGREVPVLVDAGPIRDSADHLIGAVIIFEDITPLKELERLREEWTSVVGHDLRQPVTVISGYAGLLARRAEQQAPALKAGAEHILAGARQLNRMITDLLDVSRIEARRLKLERQVVDLPALVETVVERTAAVTQGHPVRVAVMGDIPRLEADPGRLEQVLGNLLSNAAKYGYPDTEIRVEVERLNDEVRVSVANQGEGIAPEELPRLFERFRRTRIAQEQRITGLGLGLYITRGLVEAHGGRIWAESIPGRTTTFRFILPLRSVATGVG